MNQPHQIIDVRDDKSFTIFHVRLSQLRCSRVGIEAAWERLRFTECGDFNVTTITYSSRPVAEAFHQMPFAVNAGTAQPQDAESLNPGDVIVKWEPTRLSPGKVSVWFRHAASKSQPKQFIRIQPPDIRSDALGTGE
jgi:hypothetical protein